MKKNVLYFKGLAIATILALLLFAIPSTAASEDVLPGTDDKNLGPSEVTFGSILPVVTEIGYVSLSVDGLGVFPGETGTIQVEKPAGATVRKAFLGAASTGFTQLTIPNGAILLNGNPVSWTYETPSSIHSWNYWADVTEIVKPTVDAAAAGRVDFSVSETLYTYYVDGEILAVIFDDPNQLTSNTVVLLFGAQSVSGDTFNIALAEPIDTASSDLVLNLSLGISYSWQIGGNQSSLVTVNGNRLTSWAGGEDDGSSTNGALLTVGGLDDSNENPPDPYAIPVGNYRYDDELYDLIPFVNTGDTLITVHTVNPSNDDNIFFASLFLTGEALVGEGILLSPADATNFVGEEHTLTALVQDDNGDPVVGRDVTFTIVSGPHLGLTHTEATNEYGEAFFTYTGLFEGTDIIEASFTDNQDKVITSNQAAKTWESPNRPPVADANGPYYGYEGSPILLDGSGSYDPDGDAITFAWTTDKPLCTFDDTESATPQLTCTDNGEFTVTLTVSDGQESTITTAEVTVENVAPAVVYGCESPSLVAVGTSLPVTGSFTDPGTNDTHTALWGWGDGSSSDGTVVEASGSGTVSGSHTYSTAGIFTIGLTVTDDGGGSGTAEAQCAIVYDPSAGFVTGGGFIDSPYGALRMDTPLPFFKGSYYELVEAPGIDWETANAAANTATSVEGCAYPHLVTITSQEEQNALYGFFDGALQGKWYGGFQIEPQPDPAAGWNWVTGEAWGYTNWAAGEPNDNYGTNPERFLIGWLDGWAWNDEANLDNVTGYAVEYEKCGPVGKANFGFVSKYQKGAVVPTGNTEFQFRAADLNFHSNTYDWLVITGSNYARYKGVGTINGEGAYKFMLWAGDGRGPGGADVFRIKIWTEAGGVETVIYDNGMEQAISGGSIIVHSR